MFYRSCFLIHIIYLFLYFSIFYFLSLCLSFYMPSFSCRLHLHFVLLLFIFFSSFLLSPFSLLSMPLSLSPVSLSQSLFYPFTISPSLLPPSISLFRIFLSLGFSPTSLQSQSTSGAMHAQCAVRERHVGEEEECI